MNHPNTTEAATKADFQTILRYGQVWEDADILLGGLSIQPGDHCLSIGSAGENALAMLTRDPARVVAVDLNPAQTAAIHLRVAAFQTLSHAELLELIGSSPSDRRLALYDRCRPALTDDVCAFWEHSTRKPLIQTHGIGGCGKFENYFRLFRRRILPLIHSRHTINELLLPRSPEERQRFYNDSWNTFSWRLLFKIFFSRFVMGRLGRDPALFAYVQGSVGDKILARAKHALTELDPSKNPYLQWILLERHNALPLALRPEHFDTIRSRLNRLQIVQGTLESALDSTKNQPQKFSRFNLSDIFEYMSQANFTNLLTQIHAGSSPSPNGAPARLAYWNMLVPRSRPESLASKLKPLDELSQNLFLQDKAFFYSRFIIEEAIA
jgi:S-adenosylmethionine-diacylglycerol 3-amino-3-carboxypropyl transferase